MAHDFEITRNAAQNRFELEQDGLVARADYVASPGVLTVTHVVVPQALRGRGLATLLAEAAIACARRENLKIVAQCPFMAAHFERHPEHRDVLAAA